jgi:serine/threonine protein kinase
MDNIAEAILLDGKRLPYVIKDNPPRGGMKYTYFAPDKSYVVQFFNDPSIGNSPHMLGRLDAIVGKYNPTRSESEGGAIGNSAETAKYFADKFCWPMAIVESPEFGIVCPAYPSNFFFTESSSTLIDLDGKDKKSNWFTSKNRNYLNRSELGDFRSMLQMSIMLARSIRRMHQAGLAHSDLSNNNVLIDPKSGRSIVIDIDSLVVPGLYPPEVVGTRGYIAPEVLATLGLPFTHPGRKLPSVETDLHALPVLIYEYLFFRHPLIGPKIYSPDSSEEDDFLALGSMATFIEHPTDHSNRPNDLRLTINDLGVDLAGLFVRAFVDGLKKPFNRPSAMEWEKALVKAWDLLHKCDNPSCPAQWFILHNVRNPVCPHCGTRVKREDLLRLRLKSEIRGRQGQWIEINEINVYHNMPLFKWHVFSNVHPGEKADITMQAYVCKYNGQWILVNHNISGMISPGGSLVPIGQAVLLKDGVVFRASIEPKGMLIEVSAPK